MRENIKQDFRLKFISTSEVRSPWILLEEGQRMRVRITEEDNLGWRKKMIFEEKAIDER
jgi:hypothetical protein